MKTFSVVFQDCDSNESTKGGASPVLEGTWAELTLTQLRRGYHQTSVSLRQCSHFSFKESGL